MVIINRIYTRAGDRGMTRLADGSPVSKDDPRCILLGDLDELNSATGQARTIASAKGDKTLQLRLIQIQNELFDIGAQIANPHGVERVRSAQVERLEHWIDEVIKDLPVLHSFVLPGSSSLDASLHLARSVCRRAERSLAALSRAEPVPDTLSAYINRLSDFFFAAARRAAEESGAEELLWKE